MSRIASAAFKGLGELVSPLKKVAGGAKAVGLDFSSPALAFGAGVPTALMAVELGKGLGSSVKQEFVGFDRDLRDIGRDMRYQAAQQMKARRLQAAMADNMMRLAAANPQLYNQLLAGRTLPTGAVLIGGGKKTDFLESVAYQMATGGFGNPQGTTDSPDIMQSLINSY
jgi:hypothetical protein